MDNSSTTTFSVYLDKLSDVLKSLDKLASKAKRYNTPFEYSVGDTYKAKVDVYEDDEYTQTEVKKGSYWVDAVDITVTMEAIKLNGWELEARVEDDPMCGRIVLPYGDNKRKEEWKTVALRCDHCGTNRRRKIVYIVRNGNGDERMVGNSCLHDYTGINPAGIISWAMVKDLFLDMTVGEQMPREKGSVERHHYFEIVEILGLACDVVKANGFVPTSEPCSTKTLLQNELAAHEEASEEGKAKAEKIVEWFKGKTFDYSRFEDTIRDMCVSGYVRDDMLGTLVCAPGIYDRAMEKAALANMEGNSVHVGNIGERLHIPVANARCVTAWESCYNGYTTTVTFLYKILGEDGNVYVWKTAKDLPDDVKEIVGTVKAHNEYNGVAQTELTRCKVVA